jgi:hypothetical protein
VPLPPERFLAKQAMAAYDRKHPGGSQYAEAVTVLRNWNGQMEIPLAAPMLMRLVYERVRDAFARSASPGRWQLYSYFIAPSVIQPSSNRARRAGLRTRTPCC